MHRALSALLPVRNAQGTLERTILEWLEILPELTPNTEIIVVDDASCDATIEVAAELMAQYPQLRVFRQAPPRGWHASLLTAMDRSRGEILFIPDAQCVVGLNELPRVWRLLNGCEVVLALPASRATHKDDGAGAGGYQLGFRHVFESLRSALSGRSALVAALQAGGYQFLEAEAALRHPPMAAYRTASLARKLFARPTAGPMAGPQNAPLQAVPGRLGPPNYLSRLRELARGQ